MHTGTTIFASQLVVRIIAEQGSSNSGAGYYTYSPNLVSRPLPQLFILQVMKAVGCRPGNMANSSTLNLAYFYNGI